MQSENILTIIDLIDIHRYMRNVTAPVRADIFRSARTFFPALQKRGVLFDNPAGTQAPETSTKALRSYMEETNANAGGSYPASQWTDRNSQLLREKVSQLVGATPEEIVFGPNMTSLAFSVARALSPLIRSDDEIVVTASDHDANIAPWLSLAREKGATVHTIPLNRHTHSIDLDELERVLNPRTRLVGLGWVSNITGTIVDIEAAMDRIRTTSALVFLDATQAVPHLPVNFAESRADFMAFSAYKLFGPHMGVLVGKSRQLQEFSPPTIRYAHPEAPRSWEVGTQNFEAQAAALGTFEYFDSLIGAFGLKPGDYRQLFQEIQLHERTLSQRLLQLLENLPLQILGITDTDQVMHRVPTFALHARNIDARALSEELIRREFFVRNGHFHANHVLDAYGLAGTADGCLRAGMAHYNTIAEVEAFADALVAVLGSAGRQ